MSEKLKAYLLLQDVVDNNPSLKGEDVCNQIESQVKLLTIQEEFNLPLDDYGNDWFKVYTKVGDAAVGKYGEDYNRTITWSDDGKQPEEEWLFYLGFPTGAYIFGNYPTNSFYPKETFDQFFQELKDIGVKYCDTNNHKLYYTSENARKAYDALPKLYDKYKELVSVEMNKKRVQELEAELSKLKGE
jgi:hypothetical protein